METIVAQLAGFNREPAIQIPRGDFRAGIPAENIRDSDRLGKNKTFGTWKASGITSR
jgi:hypothetical protein